MEKTYKRDKLVDLIFDYKNLKINEEELKKRLKSINKEILFYGCYFESLTSEDLRKQNNQLKNENNSLKMQLKEAKEYLHSNFRF